MTRLAAESYECRGLDDLPEPRQGGMKGSGPIIPSTFDVSNGVTMRPILIRRPSDRFRTRGQSLAEFAIVFPVLMVILGGVIQFGIIFWGQNSLNQVVRDAGRYAVTQPSCNGASQTDVSNQVAALASSMGVAKITGSPTVVMPTNGEIVGGTADPISDNNGVATPNFCPATTNADHVWIRITVNAQVPIFFPFVPGNGAISSTALFRMEPVNP